MPSPFMPSRPLPPKVKKPKKPPKSQAEEVRIRQHVKQMKLDAQERELEERELAQEVERKELEAKRKDLESLVSEITAAGLLEAKQNPPEVTKWRDVEIIDNMARRALGLEQKGGQGGAHARPLINLNFVTAAPLAARSSPRPTKTIEV